MTHKEIFLWDIKNNKPLVFQYSDVAIFETMLGRFRRWESEGKLTILRAGAPEYPFAGK